MTTYSRDRTQCFLNQCFARISAVPALLCWLGILPRRALLCAERRSWLCQQPGCKTDSFSLAALCRSDVYPLPLLILLSCSTRRITSQGKNNDKQVHLTCDLNSFERPHQRSWY